MLGEKAVTPIKHLLYAWPQRPPFLMLSFYRGEPGAGLAQGDQQGKAGRRVAAQPRILCISKSRWAELNPKPHAGNKLQGDGAQPLLHPLCLPSSKSAQLSQSPPQATPWSLPPDPGRWNMWASGAAFASAWLGSLLPL